MTDDKPTSQGAPRKPAGKPDDTAAPAKPRTRAAASDGDAGKAPARPRARAGEAKAKAADPGDIGTDKPKAATTQRKRPAKAAATKASATPIAAVAAPTTATSARPRAAAAPSPDRGVRTRPPAPPPPVATTARPQAVRRASPRPRTDRAATGDGRRPAPASLARALKRAGPYLRLCRLDRPIGYLLLLWPTWWGLWAAAEGTPPVLPLLVFTLGVVLMRSAGCVINDYADRWLDPQVQRTRSRPLATGEVSAAQALALFLALLTAAFLLVLLTNALTIRLAFVGAVLAASYPFLKRYTHLPQIYLGVAFGWAIPMAFAAIQGEVPRLAWLLFIATVLWATAYDTLYAMVDRDDDVRAGAKSTAILFGDMDLVAVAMLHATFLLAMLFVGQQLQFGAPFLVALALAAALCGLQLWRARRRDREGCFRAFLNNHWVGLVLFLGLAIGLAQR